jgi:tetratricopeptide (TPR) repeat protein
MLNKLNISSKKQILIGYVLLMVATLAVFWQVNQFDFINLDDPVYVTENKSIQSGLTLKGVCWAFSTTHAQFWHPLTWLSLMFDYQLHGLNAGGYHRTNLILHLMSTLLLFWLFNRMTGAIWRSAFVAALFALHPLHVESVAWIAERKDVLSAFFWMLTLCLYVYYTEKPATKRYLLVLLCFACGLMSKSMIVTLPLVIILLDYWPLGRLQQQKIVTNMTEKVPISADSGRKKTKSKKGVLKENVSPPIDQKLSESKIAGIIPLWQIKEKIPFFIISAVFSILTLYAQYKPSFKGFSLSSRMANAPVSFVTYLEKTFWPHDLAVFYPFTDQLPLWQVLGTALLIIVISVAVIVMVKRLPCLFVGWLWYAITLLPVIGIVQVGKHAMADRYTYLPLIGISIMLAWGIPSLIKREETQKMVLFPAGVVFLAVLSFLTWQQCGYWKNSITLFNQALQATKDNYLAHNNLGVALVAEGKNDDAIAHYIASIKIKSNYDDAHTNLGVALAAEGKSEEAIFHHRMAIKINPNNDLAHYNLGMALKDQGKMEEAFTEFSRSISIKPSSADAHNNMGIVFEMHFKKYSEAIYHYRQALQIDSNNAGTHFNLGIALAKNGNLKEAAEQFRQAINIKPDYDEARQALKLALELEKKQ